MTGPEDELRAALRAAAERTAATPPSAQGLLRAHQRHLHRRNAAIGASLAAAGVGAWGISDLVSATSSTAGDTVRIGPAGTASPSPHSVANPACAQAPTTSTGVQPTPSPSPSTASGLERSAAQRAQAALNAVQHPSPASAPQRDGLTRISLPDPAPGFPVRRNGPDNASAASHAGVYMTRIFLLAVTPGTTRTLAPGVTETRPTGQEATVMVACHGAFPTTPDEINAQRQGEVIGMTTARGRTATVVRSDTHQIGVLLTYDGLDIAAYGDYSSVPNDPVTPDQLVRLIDALEHLDG